jgi:IS1 family transposase
MHGVAPAFYQTVRRNEKANPMANVLPRDKQLLCLKMLCEGNSIRAVERTAEVHRDTVMRLMVRFGEGCQNLLDTQVRGVDARHLEIDEQWTWVAKKNRNCSEAEKETGIVGDQYLFIAFDQQTGLIACHDLGKRTEDTTRRFLARLANRIVLPENVNVHHSEKPQLSTDGFNAYPNAIVDVFGSYVQHGVIIKNYANPDVGRYAPPDLADCDRRRMQYVEDLWTICTSHVERFNCTLAFSKKLENLQAATAMHIANYNFCWRSRENDGFRTGRKRLTPAMQAGVVDTLWSFSDLYDAAM